MSNQLSTSTGNSGLLNFSVVVLVISAAAFVWGYWYISTHQLVGFAAAFGYQDPTYNTANGALVLGALGFVLGIGLLIAGLIKKAK